MPKSRTHVFHDIFSDLAARNQRIFRIVLQDWMFFAIKQIQQDLTRKYIKKDLTTELTNWDFIEEHGKRIIKPATLKIMQSAGNKAYKQLAVIGSFDVLNVYAVKAADKFGAKLVKEITANTRKGVRTFVSEGIKAGKSMNKIARELRPLVGLTKRQTESIIGYRRLLGEKFPNLTSAQVDKKVMTYTNKTHRQRMESIARTETARAQNIGYAQGLEEIGVVEGEFLISPTDACDICVGLDGTRYPVADAAAIIPVHPNCRCVILPVVGEEAVSGMLASPPPELPGAFASPEGRMTWPKYRALHEGEKSSTGLLYDFYKLRFETTGKMAEGTKKFLRAKAGKYEAASLKISKPIPGLEDIIKPIKVPLGPKPTIPTVPKPKPAVPKPAVPKPLTQKEWEAGLSKEQKKAFHDFTRSYEGMDDIRSGKFVEYRQAFDDALKTAPEYQGTVYRGFGILDDVDINVYKKGGTVKFDVSTSSSKLKSVADEFLGYADDVGNIPVQLILETRTGVDISKLSVFKSQKEVLLRKGSKFKIVKEPEWIVNTSYEKGGYYRIHLEEIVAKPKLPGLLPKSFYNEVDKWEERLASHKVSLQKRLGFDIKALKVHRTDLPEYKEALKKFETALKSYTKPTADFDSPRKFLDLQGVYAKFEAKAKRSINQFYSAMQEIAGDSFIKGYGRRRVSVYIYEDRVVKQTYTRYRANAKVREFSIQMSQSDNVGVYFHELGHLVEDQHSVKNKAFRWLRSRGQGKSMPYNKISSWSKDPQKAYKDKFIDPYVGKFYRDGSTEVMSMGLQQFTSYKQMMRFAKKDFDHFAFIHGILTGAI